VFTRWRPHLGKVQVLPSTRPGRERRLSQPPRTDLRGVVDDLFQEILPLTDVPFALFGHSMGGLIAFELARKLRNHDIRPQRLIVSGRRPPHLPPRTSPVHQLSNDDFVHTLNARFNAIPQVLLDRPKMLKLFLPALRGDYTMFETYEYEPAPPLDVPILFVGGQQDPHTPVEELEGWRQHTTAAVDIRLLPGGHFYFQKDPSSLLTVLAEVL
jgi:medium-chain acyl-[acyl-carrier-protein] hydrolase